MGNSTLRFPNVPSHELSLPSALDVRAATSCHDLRLRISRLIRVTRIAKLMMWLKASNDGKMMEKGFWKSRNLELLLTRLL